MTCKDCIHERVCYSLIKSGLPYVDEELPAEAFCMTFRGNTDFVKVIRCKDCKYWDKQKDSLQGRCILSSNYPTGAWYCANAERKDEQ